MTHIFKISNLYLRILNKWNYTWIVLTAWETFVCSLKEDLMIHTWHTPPRPIDGGQPYLHANWADSGEVKNDGMERETPIGTKIILCSMFFQQDTCHLMQYTGPNGYFAPSSGHEMMYEIILCIFHFMHTYTHTFSLTPYLQKWNQDDKYQ